MVPSYITYLSDSLGKIEIKYWNEKKFGLSPRLLAMGFKTLEILRMTKVSYFIH